jgi:Zn-finger nucleic acid-binding protein
MNRINFAHSSGVILDICKKDGVWLDRGELQRVVGFVEQGGLARSREHEREQLADERRRLEATRASTATSMPAYQGGLTLGASSRQSSTGSPMEQLLWDALGLFIK